MRCERGFNREEMGERREVKKGAAEGEEGDRGDKGADKGEQVQE